MDDDSVWKEILDGYFEEFLRFFFPAVHRDIDWRADCRFLDKELQRLWPARGRPDGRRYVDKLVDVQLRGGRRLWVILHIEVQDRARSGFAARMFTYNYRIRERYGRDVASLALLTDVRRGPRTEQFGFERWSCRLLFEFPVVRLGEFAGRVAELEADPSPFALLVLAHLERRGAREPAARLEVKISLVRRLYERGYAREDIIRLFRFLDWLVRLPEGLDERFQSWLEEYQKEKAMPYVTSVERLAMERGRKEGRKEGLREGLERGEERGLKQGLQQGLKECLLEALVLRFGEAARDVVDSVREVSDLDELRRILRRALEASDLDDVKRAIGRRADSSQRDRRP